MPPPIAMESADDQPEELVPSPQAWAVPGSATQLERRPRSRHRPVWQRSFDSRRSGSTWPLAALRLRPSRGGSRVDPRRLVPPHTHADVDEFSYILEGEIGARIGDRIISARQGTYVLKPRGILHTFWNATDRPARLLEILSPAKFEKFFEEMGDVMKHPGPDTPQQLGAAAARHNTTMSMDWVTELKSAYGLKLIGEP